jgi:guanylate kinase
MLMNPKTECDTIAGELNFPKKGEIINGKEVLSAECKLDQRTIFSYEIRFAATTKPKEVVKVLKDFYTTHSLGTTIPRVVKYHDYQIRSKNNNTVISGALHVVPVALQNPGLTLTTVEEFNEDYSSMVLADPTKKFNTHTYQGFKGPEFRAKLFTFVSYMGENYGYCDDKLLYHRRASLIMPKINITMAVGEAKMFYHTHPKKDEPSLTSPDDYLLYFDFSHKPRQIRNFYTVMEDRMDYFHIVPKNGEKSKGKYLQIDEAKFLKEVDAQIDNIEDIWIEKIPDKDSSKQDGLRYCEGVTRDLVKWMNKKYASYFTIKYECHYKVRKNPPEPPSDDIHLGNEFLVKALNDIKSGEYTWPEFNSQQMPHENYAYWHQMYYVLHGKDYNLNIGMAWMPGDERRFKHYLKLKIPETEMSYEDALNILNFAYDVARNDSEIRDAGTAQSRMKEITEFLGMPETLAEDLIMLEQLIHTEDPFGEVAKTLSGDYYPLILLSNYSIQAVEIMKQVKSGKMDLQTAKVEVYSQLKEMTRNELAPFFLEKNRLEWGANVGINPPITFGRVELYAVFPTEAFKFSEIYTDALAEFGANTYDITKPFETKTGGINLKVPTQYGLVSMTIAKSTGKAQISHSSKDYMEAAMEAVNKVGMKLYQFGAEGIDPEDFEVKVAAAAMNPAPQVIAISGPSGSGKSTTLRALLKALPNAKTVPTMTTRDRRRSDKPGEKTFVKDSKFKQMLEAGELVAARLQRNGHYYGRKRSDFTGAEYIVLDVSLSGLNDIREVFPNTFSVYLEPSESVEYIEKRLLRRGDMSPQEAKARARLIPSHIKSSQAMDFNIRVKTMQGKFDRAAQEVLEAVPKTAVLKNPETDEDKGFTIEQILDPDGGPHPRSNPRMDDIEELKKHSTPLRNPNKLTLAQIAKSVHKDNYRGGGAFGSVFTIPGTNYVFKVNAESDQPFYFKLKNHLKDGSPITYQIKDAKLYKVDYHIPFEAGQPRFWIRKGEKGRDIVMNNIEGNVIESYTPQKRFETFKQRQGAREGKTNYYPKKNIIKYYKYIQELSNIPQSSVNTLAKQIKHLMSKGIVIDVNSGNVIYNPKTKTLHLIDWFWDARSGGKTVLSGPPFVQVVERIGLAEWSDRMVEYFNELHEKFPDEFNLVMDLDEKHQGYMIEWLNKVTIAFKKEDLTRGKRNIEGTNMGTPREGESYEDFFTRIVEEGNDARWTDAAFQDGADRFDYALANPNKFNFEEGRVYTFDELPNDHGGASSLKEDAIHHFRSKEEGGYGWPGNAEDAIYTAVMIPVDKLVERFGHLQGSPQLEEHIRKHGIDYPSIGNEGNNRRVAMAHLGRPMPHLEITPAETLFNPNTDIHILVNGSREGTVKYLKDKSGYELEIIDEVNNYEKIPDRLVQWFVREVSEQRMHFSEDTDSLLRNWLWLKQASGDQKVKQYIINDLSIDTPNNPLKFQAADVNEVYNHFHSDSSNVNIEKYQLANNKYGDDAKIVHSDSNWMVIELNSAEVVNEYANLANNSWCVTRLADAKHLASQGLPFYMVMKASGGQYALIHLASNQIMNTDNRPLRDVPEDLAKILTKIDLDIALYMVYKGMITNVPQEVIDYVAADPERSVKYAENVTRYRFPEGEAAIATSAEYSFRYAKEAIKDRFPAGEKAIATSAKWSSMYAKYVIKGRFPAGEAAIATSAEYSFRYAKEAIKDRFPAGEKVIATDPKMSYDYAEEVINHVSLDTAGTRTTYIRPLDGGKPWPPGEAAIATSAEYSFNYAYLLNVSRPAGGGHGGGWRGGGGTKPWPPGEAAIATSAKWSFKYARDVIQSTWTPGEAAIAKSAQWSYTYADQVVGGRWIKGEPAIAKDQLFRNMYQRNIIKNKHVAGWNRLVLPYKTTRGNPKTKLTVRIEESTKSEKKLMAVFTKPNGRTKTVHFGARGMSDYTQHKDPKRKKNYLARHGGMGEDWSNPMTAGALSRWILWGKPSLRESFNDFKKKFKIEGVMAVTNTKMNPPIGKDAEGNDIMLPSEEAVDMVEILKAQQEAEKVEGVNQVIQGDENTQITSGGDTIAAIGKGAMAAKGNITINPSEWRHGAKAEDDPFEEYF